MTAPTPVDDPAEWFGGRWRRDASRDPIGGGQSRIWPVAPDLDADGWDAAVRRRVEALVRDGRRFWVKDFHDRQDPRAANEVRVLQRLHGVQAHVVEVLEADTGRYVMPDLLPLPGVWRAAGGHSALARQLLALQVARDVATTIHLMRRRVREAIAIRDIKLANLYLEPDPDGWTLAGHGDQRHRAVLGDFGTVQLADGGLTRSGHIVGTPDWLAPETIRYAAGGADEPGTPVDSWAIGLLLLRSTHDHDGPVFPAARHGGIPALLLAQADDAAMQERLARLHPTVRVIATGCLQLEPASRLPIHLIPRAIDLVLRERDARVRAGPVPDLLDREATSAHVVASGAGWLGLAARVGAANDLRDDLVALDAGRRLAELLDPNRTTTSTQGQLASLVQELDVSPAASPLATAWERAGRRLERIAEVAATWEPRHGDVLDGLRETLFGRGGRGHTDHPPPAAGTSLPAALAREREQRRAAEEARQHLQHQVDALQDELARVRTIMTRTRRAALDDLVDDAT